MREDWRRLLGPALPGLLLVVGCGLVLDLHLEAVLIGVALLGTGAVAVTAVVLSIQHAWLVHRLRRVAVRRRCDGADVELVAGAMPFVAGLVRPRIFADGEALDRLDDAQRRAVLLHEQAHRDRFDPARLVLLEAVRRCLGWIPAVGAAEESARASLEIRADRHAVALGVSRADLAGALLDLAAWPGAVTTAGFGAVTERRLRALLGDDLGPDRAALTWLVVVAVLAVAVVVCVALSAGSHPELGWLARCVESGCRVH